MKKASRLLSLILSLALALCLIGTSQAEAAASFTITDVLDREISFEKAPETFIVANYIFNFLLVGGAESLEKVVGLTMDGYQDTRYGEYMALTEAYPRMLELKSIGGYHDDVLNSELILELLPDCILIGRSQYAENETQIGIREKAGIHVVVLDYHKMLLENDLRSTEILGKLLGREETAAALNAAYEAGITTVQERIATLSDDEKNVKVYVELGNRGVGEVGNSYDGMLWGAMIDNIGAINLAKGVLEEGYGPLDLKYVLEQDPDIIVVGGSIWSDDVNGDQMRMGFTVDEALAQARLKGFAERPEWANLKAVQNGEIYGVDHGSLRNALDYTFTEFMAKIVYPGLFEDLDPQAEYAGMLEKYLPEVTAPGTFMIKYAQ